MQKNTGFGMSNYKNLLDLGFERETSTVLVAHRVKYHIMSLRTRAKWRIDREAPPVSELAAGDQLRCVELSDSARRAWDELVDVDFTKAEPLGPSFSAEVSTICTLAGSHRLPRLSTS
jgi:hypothetical protein